MSRWSAESLLIALYPSRVVSARIEAGWRTKITDRRVVEADALHAGLAGGAAANASDRGIAWQGTLGALDKLLASMAAPRVPATVVIASRFVRYAIVPWRDNVVTPQERDEFARHGFRSIYGDAAANWEIRVSPGGFRRSSLASAVDAEMLRGVEGTLASRGVSVTSIQPNFMATCNRYRRELSDYPTASIAVLEPRRVTLGIYDRNGWRYLSTRRIGSLGPSELVPVLAQELKSAAPDGLPEDLFVAAFGPTTNSFFRTRTKAWTSPEQSRIPEPIS